MTVGNSFAGASILAHFAPADNEIVMGRQEMADEWDVPVECVLKGWSEMSLIPLLARGSEARPGRDRSYGKPGVGVAHVAVDTVESIPSWSRDERFAGHD